MALCVNKDWLADTEKHHARFVFDPKTTHERPKRIEQTAQFIVLSCLGAFEKHLSNLKAAATELLLSSPLLLSTFSRHKKNLARTLASTPKCRHHAVSSSPQVSTSGKCPTAYVVKRKAWTAPVTNIDCSTRQAFRSLSCTFNLKKAIASRLRIVEP